MSIELPICQYRTFLKNGNIHCSHTLIYAPSNQVTAEMCIGCHWYNVPCNPRPKPPDEHIAHPDEIAINYKEVQKEMPKVQDCGCGNNKRMPTMEEIKERMEKIKERMEKIKRNG